MSFGFSIGDFIAVVELAWKIRNDFASAPDQFEQIKTEVRSLHIVLQDVQEFLNEHDDTIETRKNDIREITSSCKRVLEDIQTTLDKNSPLETREDGVRRRARRVWGRLKWNPDEIRDLRSRIISNITLLNSFTASDTRANVLRLIERQDQQQGQQQRQEVLEWLTALDPAAQQSDFIHRRQAGTGQWLIDSPQYSHWRATQGEDTFCSKNDTAICYSYCNFRRQEEQTLENVVLSFVKQLSQAVTAIPESLKELFDQCQAKRNRPSREEAIRTLHSVAGLFARILIVVDALDECQTSDGCQGELISQLLELQRITGANILATSRPVPLVVDRFRDFVSLEICASKEDIIRYIDGNSQNLPGFVNRSPDLLDEVRTGVVDAVDGMFLLAKLHLNSLKGKRSPRELRKTLNTLATGIDAYSEAYHNTMLRICGQLQERKELPIQTLMWIVHSKGPLATTELLHALGVVVDELEFFEDNIPEIQDAISACRGLVTIDEESQIIRVIHYTTQEFFEQHGAQYFPDAQAIITDTCVTYLSSDVFGSGSCKLYQEFEQRLAQFPFFEYASFYWGHHANGQADFGLIQDFLTRRPHQVQGSIQVLMQHRISPRYSHRYPLRHFYDIPSSVTGLHLAAYLGLSAVILSPILEGLDLNVQDSHRETPLSYAAKNGHEAMVRLLLDKNAQVNTTDIYGQTPLSWAAKNGYEAMVRLLLDKNAQVNAVNIDDRSALSTAVVNGHVEVVKLLLGTNEVDINTQDNNGWSPLFLAATCGRESIVTALLAFGSDVDMIDRSGLTALQHAIFENHESMESLLVSNGALLDDAYGLRAMFES